MIQVFISLYLEVAAPLKLPILKLYCQITPIKANQPKQFTITHMELSSSWWCHWSSGILVRVQGKIGKVQKSVKFTINKTATHQVGLRFCRSNNIINIK